jgi:hypothetical protein
MPAMQAGMESPSQRQGDKEPADPAPAPATAPASVLTPAAAPRIAVVELNPHWPRPFVFTEIALCLRDMLREAGYEAEHLVNEVEDEGTSIVFVPTDGWQQAVAQMDPARTVLFNMEQLGSDSPWARAGYVEALGRWTVADYNTANVELLRCAHGAAQRVHEIPIVPTSSVVFARDADLAPSVDVLFFGTPSARREHVFEGLRAAGLSVEVVSGAYGWELTPAIQRARLVLHVHYYETRLFPVARMLQPLASAVPVLCETSVCPALNRWTESGIVFADYEQLVPACVALLAQPARQIECVRRSLRHARRVDTAAPLHGLIGDLVGRLRPVV